MRSTNIENIREQTQEIFTLIARFKYSNLYSVKSTKRTKSSESVSRAKEG
jgi:hypothetical protein